MLKSNTPMTQNGPLCFWGTLVVDSTWTKSSPIQLIARLARAVENKCGFFDHLRPAKGNHLDHDLLFGTVPKDIEPASTPARICHIRPQEHRVRLNDLACLKWKYDYDRPGI